MQHEQHRNLATLLLGFIFTLVVAVMTVSAERQAAVDFETQILPILQNRCFSCHSAPKTDANGTITKPKGGVELDSGKGIREVIVAGDAEDSLLYQRITLPEDDASMMPPIAAGEPLTAQETDLIRKWIAQGSRLWRMDRKSIGTPSIDDQHRSAPTYRDASDDRARVFARWKIRCRVFTSRLARLRFSNAHPTEDACGPSA